MYQNKLCGKLLLSFFAIICFSNNGIMAQITIGSNLNPQKGSLLNIQEYLPKANNATSDRGMMLPKVELTSKSSLVPLLKEGYVDTDADKSVGFMVYNVRTENSTCISPQNGVQIWTGREWVEMSTPKATPTTELGKLVGLSGTEYRTRKFGNAGWWMIDNLKEVKYDKPGGAQLSLQAIVAENDTDPSSIDKVYYYPNVSREEYEMHPEYGLLYTWSAATDGVQSDQLYSTSIDGQRVPEGTVTSTIQGICPQGWVVPSDYDWNRLEKEIAENAEKYSNNKSIVWNPEWNTWALSTARPSGSIVNGHGYSMILCGAMNPNNKMIAYSDPDGFSGIPVGRQLGDGRAVEFGETSSFWSSTTITSATTKISCGGRIVTSDHGVVYRSSFMTHPKNSIRCKKIQ